MNFKPIWKKGRQVYYYSQQFAPCPFTSVSTYTPYLRKGHLTIHRKGRGLRDNPIKFKWVNIENSPKRRGIW